ncbi:scavenger receptor class B member 1 isoform X1 [Loxodonta africana]|uniref:scavenger receptor class B member 1 isoform X1 n=1 Tax=Loxodonta africana TaxID=9785 RepID=UPI0030D1BD12
MPAGSCGRLRPSSPRRPESPPLPPPSPVSSEPPSPAGAVCADMGSCTGARRAAVALGVVGLLCVVLGAVMIVLVPSFIEQQVLKNVRIDPSSLSFNMWKEIPVPFYLSVYFFHVVNPDNVLKGEKPQVQERGPYVYREFRHKSNITFNDNDTVSFLEYRTFQFQPAKSYGLESDYIVMPNILVLTAAMLVENQPLSLKVLMSLAFSTLGERAFMNRTVGEIMWGYEDPLMDFINKYFPNLLPFNGKFGLFSELNNTHSGLFTVFTGVKDFSRIHLVNKWNGLSKVSFWHSDQCNMINGTSGQMWAPFMTPESSLEFYSPDACRSMKLVYQEAGVFEGIPIYRFVAPPTLFANGSVYPPNEGFCPCLESGIQNVSTCRFGAPLFLSHPHFYNADPVLAEAVLGLHPNHQEHSLFLDIHPVTGIPMNCSVKLQLSLYIKAVKGIGQTGSISPVVLPLLWFGESGTMEGQALQTFYTQLVLLPAVLHYAQYVLLALGCALLLIPVVHLIRSQEKCYLFWSSSKKGSKDKEAIQAYSETLMTSPPKGTVLQEARL